MAKPKTTCHVALLSQSGLSVTVSLSVRLQPSSRLRLYQLDWGDEFSVTNTVLPATSTHTFSGTGVKGIRLKVADSKGGTAESNVSVEVGATPTITALTRIDGTPTSASTVRWQAVFSEAVTGVSLGNFTLASSGVTGASLSSVSGSGALWTITASAGVTEVAGSLQLSLTNPTGILNLSGLTVTNTLAGETYITEPPPIPPPPPPTPTTPLIISLAGIDPSPTQATQVRWQAIFSEAVTGVSSSNFSLATTGITGASIASVSGSAASWLITVNTGTTATTGTLALNLTTRTGIVSVAASVLLGNTILGTIYATEAPTPPPPPPPPPSGALNATEVFASTGWITFGVVCPKAAVPAGSGIQVGVLTTQTDVQNTWSDGSARHVLVTCNVLAAGSYALSVITNPGGSLTPTWPSNTKVAFVISGTTYTATLPSFDGTRTTMNGALARRANILVTPTTSGAVEHPTLQVIFEVTSYVSGSAHKVNVTIQNIRNLQVIDWVDANVTTTVNNVTFAALTKSSWRIFTGQIWDKTAYINMADLPIRHDFTPWIAARVIPTISPSIDAKVYDLNGAPYALGVNGPLFGEATSNQGDSENIGRQELNPWCDWEARLFALNTEHYRQTVAANSGQSGAWCWQVDRTGDGRSILKLTIDDTLLTDRVAGILGNSGLNWYGYNQGGNTTAAWRGALDSQNSSTGAVGVDKEHLPEMNFVQYLLTGDFGAGQRLRMQAAWAACMSFPAYVCPDTLLWNGYLRGRNGANGYLNDGGMTREFGRPLKFVARCAWALRDGDADQSYFTTLVSNNLTAVALYIQYLNSRSWGGTWATFAGFNGGTNWDYARGNSVVSTTGANPTVLTVIGDNSGVGTGVNDHGLQTGDYTTLSGFTGGASGLNGVQVVTRISPTSFSVPVNTTGSATSSVGSWLAQRGTKTPNWRIGVGAREISWIGFTGLWTLTDDMWAFPDRVAQMELAVQDYPLYATAPGVAHNYYPTPGVVSGNTYTFYNSWNAYQAGNQNQGTIGYLLDAQATYSLYGSLTHRGNIQGWNDANPNEYYTTYANVMLVHGAKRGLPGMTAGITKLLAAADVLPALKSRAGFFQVVG